MLYVHLLSNVRCQSTEITNKTFNAISVCVYVQPYNSVACSRFNHCFLAQLSVPVTSLLVIHLAKNWR